MPSQGRTRTAPRMDVDFEACAIRNTSSDTYVDSEADGKSRLVSSRRHCLASFVSTLTFALMLAVECYVRVANPLQYLLPTS